MNKEICTSEYLIGSSKPGEYVELAPGFSLKLIKEEDTSYVQFGRVIQNTIVHFEFLNLYRSSSAQKEIIRINDNTTSPKIEVKLNGYNYTIYVIGSEKRNGKNFLQYKIIKQKIFY